MKVLVVRKSEMGEGQEYEVDSWECFDGVFSGYRGTTKVVVVTDFAVVQLMEAGG